MFKVTALPFDGTPRAEDGKEYRKISLEKKPIYRIWTIEGETFAMVSLGQIYTFGPTFRAENLILRHLAEFWMIEVAFNDLNNMDLAEDFIQYVIKYVLINVLKT
jgi:asparaginyl-tRNA synthetase